MTNSENVVGGELSYAMDGVGTITAGMSETSDTTNESMWGVKWAGSLGSSSVSVGYSSMKAGTSEVTRTEANISQSIGAGASLYLDLQNASGSGVTTPGTNLAIGTSFAF